MGTRDRPAHMGVAPKRVRMARGMKPIKPSRDTPIRNPAALITRCTSMANRDRGISGSGWCCSHRTKRTANPQAPTSQAQAGPGR